MNISWAVLESYAKGRRKLPLGWKLQYEFRPSLSWIIDIHVVHSYWKHVTKPVDSGAFWSFDKDVMREWEDKYLQMKYRQFTGRRDSDCFWQRFTLTANGKSIILHMDNQGRVNEIRPIKKTIVIDTFEVVR